MAWLYCQEALPGPNSPHDYVHVLGHLFSPLPAKEWTKLPAKFERPWFYDSRERGKKPTQEAILNARKDFHTGAEFAEAAIEKFGERGLVWMDSNPETNEIEAKRLEKKSAALNHQWRERAIAHFEDERRRKIAGDGGRFEPTKYELECFKELGLPIPGSIDEIKAAKTPGKLELSSELIELLDNSDRVKKLEALNAANAEQISKLTATVAALTSKPAQHQPRP